VKTPDEAAMIAFVKRVSTWGIASLVLLVGELVLAEYDFYRVDHGRQPLSYSGTTMQLCVVLSVAAVVCGAMAIGRGSKWWVLTVVPATVLAFACWLGDF
jgi:hypothetical protein